VSSSESPEVLKPTRCQICGQPIVFQRTVSGKAMPCNARMITLLTIDGKTVRGYESHFASCRAPNIDGSQRISP
jgi:hypothetical protein